MQEFVNSFSSFDFNGNPAERDRDEDDFEKIEIDIEKEEGPEEDNEKATCSKEFPTVTQAEEQVTTVVVPDGDDDGNICRSCKNLVFNYNISG